MIILKYYIKALFIEGVRKFNEDKFVWLLY